MKKSVRRVLIIVMAMMCCLLVTVPVSAAKKPSMKTVTRTYRKFLKNIFGIPVVIQAREKLPIH